MVSLTSIATVAHLRLGTVGAFNGVPGLDPRTLLHKDVKIDGVVRTITGVETLAVPGVTGKAFRLSYRLSHKA